MFDYHRVLVSGGAGFIGSHLVDELVNQGMSVTILDNLSTGRLANIRSYVENDAIRFVKGYEVC